MTKHLYMVLLASVMVLCGTMAYADHVTKWTATCQGYSTGEIVELSFVKSDKFYINGEINNNYSLKGNKLTSMGPKGFEMYQCA